MTMHLLKQIAGSRLPATFYRTDDIDQVRGLRAAGLIVALVPSSSEFSSRTPSAAHVLAITQKGREKLAQFSYPQSPPPRWRFRMPRIKTATSQTILGRPASSRDSARPH